MCRMRRSGLAEMHFWFRCYRNPKPQKCSQWRQDIRSSGRRITNLAYSCVTTRLAELRRQPGFIGVSRPIDVRNRDQHRFSALLPSSFSIYSCQRLPGAVKDENMTRGKGHYRVLRIGPASVPPRLRASWHLTP
jgi:hypothetical protein